MSFLYVFILTGRKKKNCSSRLFSDHVRHLKSMEKKGFLVMCGPFADRASAIQIFRSTSPAQALKFFKKDPFVAQKYYSHFEMRELREWRCGSGDGNPTDAFAMPSKFLVPLKKARRRSRS